MAVNINTVRNEATEAVLAAMLAMYDKSDPDAMRGMAEAIAEAAVVAVQNVLDHAELDALGQGLQ